MNFLGIPSIRRLRPLATALLLAVLASCGGGTSQIDAFVAKHVVAFGDEHSVITDDGKRYLVNRFNDQNVLDCTVHPIWTQSVASIYGFVFAECNPANVAEPKAVIRAAVGARVADLATQVDAQLAGAGVGDDTLVTVLVGMHDVLELYADFPNTGSGELLAEARRRGGELSAQINRLIDAGARVIVATVPDVGVTPFALAEKAANTDTDRAKLLSELTTEFNAGMRTTVLNDGRFVGLVLADEMTQAMVKAPSAFGLANVTTRICTAALPDCTTATMASGADAATWLWADDTRFGFTAHNRLGLLAVNRATNNPF